MTLSDTKVASLIQREFVAAWESIRPVPKVNIDFGDGRTLKRTLAGNTVMYVCLPDGRVVDAFPGVYTPDDLLKEMEETLALVKGKEPTPAELAKWHHQRAAAAVMSERIRITMSKAFVESPLLSALGASRRQPQPAAPGAVPVATQPAAELRLELGTPKAPAEIIADPKAALAAVSDRIEDISKGPATAARLEAQYAKVPAEKRPTPEKLGEMVVYMDSQTNVRLVRPAVHLLFTTYDRIPATTECRDAVFKQVLHVPIDDPYLGLADVLVPGTPAGQ